LTHSHQPFCHLKYHFLIRVIYPLSCWTFIYSCVLRIYLTSQHLTVKSPQIDFFTTHPILFLYNTKMTITVTYHDNTTKTFKKFDDIIDYHLVKILDCSYNKLKKLPALPTNLQHLYCYNNQLTQLPTLPDSLQKLNCSYNQLTLLPTLPESLQYLDCWSNQFTLLPALSNSLQLLYCGDNQLTTLPTLPDSLQILYCHCNLLTTLPTLPTNLQQLYCGNN
jgi:hypothetical protein